MAQNLKFCNPKCSLAREVCCFQKQKGILRGNFYYITFLHGLFGRKYRMIKIIYVDVSSSLETVLLGDLVSCSIWHYKIWSTFISVSRSFGITSYWHLSFDLMGKKIVPHVVQLTVKRKERNGQRKKDNILKVTAFKSWEAELWATGASPFPPDLSWSSPFYLFIYLVFALTNQ